MNTQLKLSPYNLFFSYDYITYSAKMEDILIQKGRKHLPENINNILLEF